MNLDAIDCQGLAGAYTLGTVQAGFNIVGKLELDNFGTQNTARNAALLGEFPHVIGEEDWPVLEAPYIFGNPPCSGFSRMNTAKVIAAKAGKKAQRGRGADSPINECMWSFASYAAKVRPEIAIFESVQDTGKWDGRVLMRQLRDHLEARSGLQYDLTHVFMNGLTVGGAQQRRRYFWVVHRIPFGVNTTPVVPATVADAIRDLVGLEDQWERQKASSPPSDWARRECGATWRSNITAHVSDQKTRHGQRVRNLAQTGLWEAGSDEEDAACAAYDRDGELPDGFAFETPYRKWGFYLTRRLRWEQFMHVMAGNGLQAFVHPSEDRPLTIREGSRLMGFPDAWDWSAAAHVNQASNWMGKGVLVQAGRWISEQVRGALEGKPWMIDGMPEPAKYDDNWKKKCPGEPLLVDHEYVINITNLYKEWVS